jgi:hypothetical protein
MVRNNLAEHESELIPCQGHEGSPKGRKKYRKCIHTFKVKAWIKYKGSEPATDQAPLR